MNSLVTAIQIEQRIYFIRGHKVMLDSDLAELYGVEVRVMIQSVKRNRERFPDDFMFQLSKSEDVSLKSQIVISKTGRGGRRFLPYVFTQDGVAMLSSVLNSRRAIQVNIQIIRTFNRMKGFHLSLQTLKKELGKMKRTYEQNFAEVFDTLELLLDGPEKRIKVKGFLKSETPS